jgi:hypothetical protein
MFIVSLFTIAKLWKQPLCPTTYEWIEQMCYLYTIEFYSATKDNEILSFADEWMELENIIISEVSQDQKAKSHKFSFLCEYRPNTNTTFLRKTGHAKQRSHMRGRGQKKEVEKLNILYKSEYRIFKPVETTIIKGLR